MPLFAFLPADHAAVVRPAVDAAEVGVEVEIVEVEAHIVEGDVHRKVILMRRLAVELHPVVDGHIIPALLLQYEVRVNIAQLFRDAEGQMHALTSAYRAEGLLEIGVEAIEQTRQKGSSFLKKSPGQRCHGVFVLIDGITSPSRLAPCHLSYRGEALAFRKAFPLRQRLPSVGELSSGSETERFISQQKRARCRVRSPEQHGRR